MTLGNLQWSLLYYPIVLGFYVIEYLYSAPQGVYSEVLICAGLYDVDGHYERIGSIKLQN